MVKSLYLLCLLTLAMVSCIQTDLQDPFPPTLRIANEISDVEFRVSGAYNLAAVYTDDTGEPVNTAITWTSSNPEIISFENNIASVHQTGETIIKASANGLEDFLTVETLASRGSLRISSFAPVVQSGNDLNFKFNFIGIDGVTDNDVNTIWNSSEPTIATIDDTGLFTAISSGSTVISLNAAGVSSATTITVVDMPIVQEASIKIHAFAEFLNIGQSFQFKADYFGENGLPQDDTNISWSVGDQMILSVNETGTITALQQGTSVVTATVGIVSASLLVTVNGEGIMTRSGMLQGTGYDIEGDFSLQENSNGDLILRIENYKPDGPGPYFYLTNQATNVANGLKLEEGRTAGTVEINISEIDRSVELGTYDYLMVWCEPFSVRLGVGEFDN